MLDDTVLDTVAVGNGLALAAVTLVALANALVESLEVALVGARDLIMNISTSTRGAGQLVRNLQERSGQGSSRPWGHRRQCTFPARC